MSVPRTVAEVIRQHVTLEVEGIDRMYLNVYQPKLQTEGQVAAFFRSHRGHTFASSALMDPMTKAFIAASRASAEQNQIPLISFPKGQRKDDVAAEYRGAVPRRPKAFSSSARPRRRRPSSAPRNARTPGRGRRTPGSCAPRPWSTSSTSTAIDEDFGPFFLKFCTYFPYNAKLCINGHEYVKRQLAKEGIAFEALDNGVLRCADPQRLQQICDGLSAAKIDALLRKWLARLPHPFHRPGSEGRLPLRRVHPPGRVLPDPGARPAADGPHLLRGSHPREPGPRPSRSGATDLRAARDHARRRGASARAC